MGYFVGMYKEYMLKCQCWNPILATWQNDFLFFDTEQDMREYVVSQGNGIKVEAMFNVKKIDW